MESILNPSESEEIPSTSQILVQPSDPNNIRIYLNKATNKAYVIREAVSSTSTEVFPQQETTTATECCLETNAEGQQDKKIVLMVPSYRSIDEQLMDILPSLNL